MSVKQVAVKDVPLGRDGVVIVDVREPFEYNAGHVPGVVLIPMAEIPDHVSELAAAPELYIICRSGNRSNVVATWLARNGINAANVVGGLIAWQEADRPVEASAAADELTRRDA